MPIVKPGKPTNEVKSYRPISLTSCVAKVFEKIIKSRLQWHLDKFGLIPNFQAGFRPGFCTFDHICRLEADVKDCFNKRYNSHAVFLDIEKAYDSVWIPALLFKLTKLKVSGPINNWLRNFLLNRTFAIRINNFTSSETAVARGVPQGGVLSPTLWLIYMHDFPHPSPLIHTSLFADDIEFHTVSMSDRRAQTALQTYLFVFDCISAWAKDWCLAFSVTKSAVLTFSRKRYPFEISLLLNNLPVPKVSSFKFLRFIFDNKLNWNTHVASMKDNALRQLNALKSLASNKVGLNFKSLVRLYKAQIRSRLEYGSIILASLSKTHANNLEKIQNAAFKNYSWGLKIHPYPAH